MLTVGAVMLLLPPLMHVSAQWGAFSILYGGGTVVLAAPGTLDPHEVWSLVGDEHANILTLVGDAMARPLLDAYARDPSRYDVSSLLVFASGGAVLSASTKAQIAALLPNVITVDGFGSTETGVGGTRARMPGADVEEGTRFTLDDHSAVLDDSLHPVAPGSGVIGRLARRGHVPLGYYKDPGTSATAFVQVDHVRWALTGDAATVDADGTVVLLGRGSMSINTGGEKVYPEEVEAVVKDHPSVYDAVVVGVPHDRWGEQVVVVVALRPGATVTLDELRTTAAAGSQATSCRAGSASSTRSYAARTASRTIDGPANACSRPACEVGNMHRLAGADSLFIFNENRARHQHTLKIAVVDPAGADMPVTADALRDQIREALPLLEPFRWQLVRVPFDLGHPYWVDAPDLDLDYHVQRVAVPAPGGPREFAEVISRIASVGLERDRPLWQVWFVEGLADGHIAYVSKVHHSLADGMASERLLAEAFADRPDHTPMGSGDTLQAEPVPGWWQLLGLGLADAMRMLLALPVLMLRTVRAARRGRVHARGQSDSSARPFAGPHTRFDEPLTPHRWFAYEIFDLAKIKKVGHAFGASVNDVMIAMAAGALRTYLRAHGELPDAPLTAAVPVSVRTPDEERTWGNRITTWYVTLATDVEDPAVRLQMIMRSARVARPK